MFMNLNNKVGLVGRLEAYTIPAKYGDVSKEPIERIREIGTKVVDGHNIITNVGMQTVANRLTGAGTYSAIYYPYFAVGDGTTDPVATDTAADFYADCTNSYTKAVTTLEAFVVGTLTQQWTCYLTTVENTVASITKFALMNTTPGVVMFNTIEFAAVTKDSTKSIYFYYALTLAEV